MGGTWDSTNVIDSDVAVLTNVDLDHTAVLGTTVGAIASDKVGIFRHDGVAIVATTNAIVVEIAQQRAKELDATLWLLGDEFVLEENELAARRSRHHAAHALRALRRSVRRLCTASTRASNAATAIVAAEAFLGRALGDDVVTSTLASVHMPGRMEIIARNPMIVVDGAHNPAGVRALVATLDGAFDVRGERRCVLGMLTGRDVDDMITPLLGAGFSEFYCCAPNSPRAVPARERRRGARRATALSRTNIPTRRSRSRTRANARPTKISLSSRAVSISLPKFAARCCTCRHDTLS